jgi:protein TonB
MFQTDRNQKLASLSLSLIIHAIILFFYFPTLELKIDKSLQYAVPVRLDFDELPAAPTQAEPGSSDQKLPPHHDYDGASSPKPSTSGLDKQAVQPSSNSIAGTPKPLGLPGDRPSASTLNAVVPIYPKEALNNNWEGTVVLDVSVGIDGVPKSITLLRSSGYQVLDESFIRTVRHYYTFKPKRFMGQNMESTIRLSYTFSLSR